MKKLVIIFVFIIALLLIFADLLFINGAKSELSTLEFFEKYGTDGAGWRTFFDAEMGILEGTKLYLSFYIIGAIATFSAQVLLITYSIINIIKLKK